MGGGAFCCFFDIFMLNPFCARLFGNMIMKRKYNFFMIEIALYFGVSKSSLPFGVLNNYYLKLISFERNIER